MFKRAMWAFVVAVCLAAPVAVHAQGDYLDVYMVKVKPEKIADFQVLARKGVDANRRFNGDRWLATETLFGEGGVLVVASLRADYADIEKNREPGMLAAKEAFGKEATLTIM